MVKRSSRVQAVSEPGENVYFKHHKVDVAPGDAIGRNRVLLDGFLADRRLSGSSRDGYRAALLSFGDHVEVPLGQAGELDMRTWCARARSEPVSVWTQVQGPPASIN